MASFYPPLSSLFQSFAGVVHRVTGLGYHGMSWDVFAYPNVPFIYYIIIYIYIYNLYTYIIVINHIIIYICNLLIFAEVCPIHIWEHLA
jgi:hypothetical protein